MKLKNDYQFLKNILDISIEPKFTIKLKDSYWVMLKSRNGVVEGKLYLPTNKLTKLVVFEPGFPGGGSTQFENLWLEKLLQNDFSIFLARHNGTIINGKYSDGYLNCPERQELSKNVGFDVLGNKKINTLSDWLIEPLVALSVLSPHFSQITLCGHSFGPLALIYSLIKFAEKNPKMTKKVHRVVSLSGSIGIIRSEKDPIIKIWHDHLNTKWARDRVKIGDARKSTSIFKKAHIDINKHASKIPEKIDFVGVSPMGDTQKSFDEIVHPLETIDFITSLGRGYFIVDKNEWGDKKTGRMAHDMEALSADMILKLVSTDWLPNNNISAIG